MRAPVWLERQSVELLHLESLHTHGGLSGLRDEGLLESALARPLNVHAYEGVTDIVTLGACCGVALARNHPFYDGNKRIAFIAALVFCLINGVRIVADEADAAMMMMQVAAGDAGQAELAAWMARHAQARD